MSNLVSENAELRARVAELERELDRTTLKLNNTVSDLDAARQEAHRERVGRRIADAARREGAVDIALPDIEHRAVQGDWRPDAKGGRLRLYQDGIPAIDSRGREVTEEIWIQNLKTEAKYFFEPVDTAQASTGIATKAPSAQTGRATPPVAGDQNPFDHRSPHFNVTQQGEIFRADPAKARALALAAGWKPSQVEGWVKEPA